MKSYIDERVLKIARYTVQTGSTVRETAKVFGIGKTTVHFDLTQRLPKLDMRLSKKVNKVLEFNLNERHLRGGIATKEKYAN